MAVTLREINKRLSEEGIGVRMRRHGGKLIWVKAKNGAYVGGCCYRLSDTRCPDINTWIQYANVMDAFMDVGINFRKKG